MGGFVIGEPTMMPARRIIPRNFGELKIRASLSRRNCSNTLSPIRPIRVAGPGVSLALTKDFRTFERYGVIMPPDDKDSALLPRRINGYWVLIHRPMTALGAHMWVSYSPDLRYWGRHRLDVGSAPRGLVGCQQNWIVAAAH